MRFSTPALIVSAKPFRPPSLAFEGFTGQGLVDHHRVVTISPEGAFPLLAQLVGLREITLQELHEARHRFIPAIAGMQQQVRVV